MMLDLLVEKDCMVKILQRTVEDQPVKRLALSQQINWKIVSVQGVYNCYAFASSLTGFCESLTTKTCLHCDHKKLGHPK